MTLALLSAWLARPGRVPPGPRDLLAFSLTLLAVAWLLAVSGCSLALSVTVARGDAATGEQAAGPCAYDERDGVVLAHCLPHRSTTRASSDHWNPEAIEKLGAAGGAAAGEAARRALRPPTAAP